MTCQGNAPLWMLSRQTLGFSSASSLYFVTTFCNKSFSIDTFHRILFLYLLETQKAGRFVLQIHTEKKKQECLHFLIVTLILLLSVFIGLKCLSHSNNTGIKIYLEIKDLTFVESGYCRNSLLCYSYLK